MVKIKYAASYYPLLRLLLESNPELADTVSVSLSRFKNKPEDERLKNHALTGRLKGLWAFSVTNNVRVIYRWKDKNLAQLLAIGEHDFVYSLKLV